MTKKQAMKESGYSGKEATTHNQADSRRGKIKHLLIGSRKAVLSTINTLHVKGYAEVGEWSKPVTAGSLGSKDGDVMVILLRIAPVD